MGGTAYFWQNDLIRLRMQREEDWQATMPNQLDSEARVLFNDEIDLPVDEDAYRQGTAEWIEKNKGSADTLLFAIENAAGEHVGICNLFGIDERHGNFGPIGIEINTAHRKKGYGLAAYRILGRYMFSERRMHKWNSGYLEPNAASAAFHKKMGFVIEGVRKDRVFHDGKYWNEVLCGMTEEQFFAREKERPPLA